MVRFLCFPICPLCCFFSLTVNDMPPSLRCGLPGRFVPPGTDGLVATLQQQDEKKNKLFFSFFSSSSCDVNDETKSGFFFFRQFDIKISNKLGFDFHYSWVALLNYRSTFFHYLFWMVFSFLSLLCECWKLNRKRKIFVEWISQRSREKKEGRVGGWCSQFPGHARCLVVNREIHFPPK